MAEEGLRTHTVAQDGTVTFQMTGRLSIWDLPEAVSALREVIAKGGAVALDLSEIEEVDLAGLQLLWSAWHTAQASGTSLHVGASSPALAALAESYGFAASAGAEMNLGVEDQKV